MFSIFSICLMIFILYYEYTRKSILLYLWIVNIVIFGFPNLISTFNNNTMYPDFVILKATLFSIGFNVIYILFRVILNTKKKSINTSFSIDKFKISNNEIRFINYVFIIYIFVILIFCLQFFLAYNFSGRISWGSVFNIPMRYPSLRPLFLMNVYLLTFTSSILLIEYYYFKKRFIFHMFTLLLITLLSGARESILILMLVIMNKYVFLSKNRIKFIQLIKLTAFGLLIVYCTYLILYIGREMGGIVNFLDGFSISKTNKWIINKITSGESEFGLHQRLYHFIYYDNNFENFSKGYTYIRVIMAFIPTSFSFGLKPGDFAITMSQAVTGNYWDNISSTHPTFYGDLFANFYYYGIFFAVIWSIFAQNIDIFLNKQKGIYIYIYISLFSSMLVMIGRGSIYNPIIKVIYVSILIYFIKYLSKIRFK